MAELLVATGEDDRAGAILERARDLRRRWHSAYWLPDERFYALALDRDKRPVATIASNAGHALAAGIVPIEQARAVADRLFAQDLYSGWGVRTLSAEHPSYNPFGYHLGTVWPVEQATFAVGFKRYGFDDLVDRIVDDQLAAAAGCPGGRLPEVLAGLPRSTLDRPVAYPGSNSPQAWSASATVQLLQASLGMYAFAPLGALVLVRPRLPASIPRVTLSGVRVGRARISLAFTRERDGSARHEVIERSGRLAVIDAGPPQAGDRAWAERLAAAGLRVAPGRRFRAARIALGLEPVG
jgi:glycogen debranching enzyme